MCENFVDIQETNSPVAQQHSSRKHVHQMLVCVRKVFPHWVSRDTVVDALEPIGSRTLDAKTKTKTLCQTRETLISARIRVWNTDLRAGQGGYGEAEGGKMGGERGVEVCQNVW